VEERYLERPRLTKPPKFLDGKSPHSLPYIQFRASYLKYENSTFARPHPSLDAVQTANASPNIAVSRPKLRPIVTRIIAENVGAEAGPHWPNGTGGTNGKPDDDIRVSSLR
jgi:hypothetical protein